jgi:hypothetical protein
VKCSTVRFQGGGGAIVCGPNRGKHLVDGRCVECDRDAVATCDFPISHGREACSIPVCVDHRTLRGGADLCPAHSKPMAL